MTNILNLLLLSSLSLAAHVDMYHAPTTIPPSTVIILTDDCGTSHSLLVPNDQIAEGAALAFMDQLFISGLWNSCFDVLDRINKTQ